MEILHLKDNGVTKLTFWGHVTSSVLWHFRGWTISYGWSIVTMHLSSTVMEIWCLKCWTGCKQMDVQCDFILCPMLCIALDRQ